MSSLNCPTHFLIHSQLIHILATSLIDWLIFAPYIFSLDSFVHFFSRSAMKVRRSCCSEMSWNHEKATQGEETGESFKCREKFRSESPRGVGTQTCIPWTAARWTALNEKVHRRFVDLARIFGWSLNFWVKFKLNIVVRCLERFKWGSITFHATFRQGL